jgi:hypothetical protein
MGKGNGNGNGYWQREPIVGWPGALQLYNSEVLAEPALGSEAGKVPIGLATQLAVNSEVLAEPALG